MLTLKTCRASIARAMGATVTPKKKFASCVPGQFASTSSTLYFLGGGSSILFGHLIHAVFLAMTLARVHNQFCCSLFLGVWV